MDKNGLVILDKPAGISSFLAVKIIKRALECKKAGHMGTLDPMATGLLVVGINKGTKLFDYYLKHDKEYYAVYKFGVETDTLDSEGEIINQNDVKVTAEMLQEIIPNFLGEQNQIPPNYSAKKINGKRACDLVREGKEITLAPKKVTLYNLELIKEVDENTFAFKMHCSSGFYVRSLGRDLADKLSTYCTTLEIRRTKCCGYGLEHASSLEEIKQGKYKFIEIENE